MSKCVFLLQGAPGPPGEVGPEGPSGSKVSFSRCSGFSVIPAWLD